MARRATKTPKKPTCRGSEKNVEKWRMSGAERSAYFARREAAKGLRMVLQRGANRRAAASIKLLIYRPSIRNKKGTFALVCQTLKHLPIIKEVLEAATEQQVEEQENLIYTIVYDILFGQVQKDSLLPDLLILPAGQQALICTIILLSRMEVSFCKYAPGNKTVHLAALMRIKGRIIAFELHKERIKRLKDTVMLSGASNIEVLNEDFLNINPKAPSYSKFPVKDFLQRYKTE